MARTLPSWKGMCQGCVLVMNTNPEVSKPITKPLEEMTRDELLELATLQQSALCVLYIEGKFRPMDPSLRAGAWRYGAKSSADMRSLILGMLAKMTRTMQFGSAEPSRDEPPPSTFV
jgi:hypothetical protein